MWADTPYLPFVWMSAEMENVPVDFGVCTRKRLADEKRDWRMLINMTKVMSVELTGPSEWPLCGSNTLTGRGGLEVDLLVVRAVFRIVLLCNVMHSNECDTAAGYNGRTSSVSRPRTAP